MIPSLHQVIVGAAPGDAITDQAFAIRRWLRELGLRSEIYAESVHPVLAKEVHPYITLGSYTTDDYLIYHYSIGSQTIEYVAALPAKLILIYHNVTPAAFIAGADPALAIRLQEGRAKLSSMVAKTAIALGDSHYNELELVAAGFRDTGVLPIVIDDKLTSVDVDPQTMALYNDGIPNILCVGRLVPNKRQDDAIKVAYYCRQIGLNVRVLLVGSDWLPAYSDWLKDLSQWLGVADSVVFTGHVSDSVLAACYRSADIYLSMSEHEGFCKPLIEAMRFGVPVVAYNNPAVAETLGLAGIIFNQKDFSAVAALLKVVLKKDDVKTELVSQGKQRVIVFIEAKVKEEFCRYLSRIGVT